VFSRALIGKGKETKLKERVRDRRRGREKVRNRRVQEKGDFPSYHLRAGAVFLMSLMAAAAMPAIVFSLALGSW